MYLKSSRGNRFVYNDSASFSLKQSAKSISDSIINSRNRLIRSNFITLPCCSKTPLIIVNTADMEVLSPLHDVAPLRKGPRRNVQSTNHTKTKSPSKQLQKLFTLFQEAAEEFHQSPLLERLHAMLQARHRPRVTKAISLGLGSLVEPSKDQPRRIKQLVIFIAIATSIQTPSGRLSLYAQDPTFTKTDEELLEMFGIQVLRTPSASSLGEAGAMIDNETLVYSPFLTIAAYTELLRPASSKSKDVVAPIVIGDDFNALKLKWEKRTSEHKDVEALMKSIKGFGYQRRAISGDGFWRETDRPFPMALYWRQSEQPARAESEDGTGKRSSIRPIKEKL